MTCSKEKFKNHQCQICHIKDFVVWNGHGLELPVVMKTAVNWKHREGNAWLSIPDTSIAHCGIGLIIILNHNLHE